MIKFEMLKIKRMRTLNISISELEYDKFGLTAIKNKVQLLDLNVSYNLDKSL